MSTEDNFKKELWAYAGRRTDTMKQQDVWCPLIINDGRTLVHDSHFFTAQKSIPTIGGVYEVECMRSKPAPNSTGERISARVSSARFVKMLGDEHNATVLQWKTEHDISEVERNMQAIEKKGKELHLELLRPIREVYKQASFSQQAAIEALVLRYIRRGG